MFAVDIGVWRAGQVVAGVWKVKNNTRRSEGGSILPCTAAETLWSAAGVNRWCNSFLHLAHPAHPLVADHWVQKADERREEERRGRKTACWWPTFHRNASFVESHGRVACLHLNATEPSCAQLSAGKVCEANFHGRRFNEATPLLFGSGLFIRGKCLCWRALSVQPTTEAAAQTLLSLPQPTHTHTQTAPSLLSIRIITARQRQKPLCISPFTSLLFHPAPYSDSSPPFTPFFLFSLGHPSGTSFEFAPCSHVLLRF